MAKGTANSGVGGAQIYRVRGDGSQVIVFRELFGTIFLGILAIILLASWMRSQGRIRDLEKLLASKE